MEDQVNQLYQYIERYQDEYIDLSDRIWALAETRFEEHQSAELIITYLTQQGFEVEKKVAGIDTAFVAKYNNGGSVISFLGEYDALSGLSQHAGCAVHNPVEVNGNGHGCGHNMLGVAALAAALSVKDYLQRHDLPGTVVFFGCPAEEGGSGKTFMVRDGVFDGVDAAITWHPNTFSGMFDTPTLANIQAEFSFKGKASHAAASPHMGRSALDAVELMNVGANYLREHVPQESRLHYAITNSGGLAPNVVQAEASVLYLVRSPNLIDLQDIYRRVTDIATGAALMTETKMSVQFIKACSNYLPNRCLERVMDKYIQALGMPEYTEDEMVFMKEIRQSFTQADIEADIKRISEHASHEPAFTFQYLRESPTVQAPLVYQANNKILYGSTDVGDVSWVVPTVQCFAPCYAVGTSLHSWQAVSQGKTSVAHKGLLLAAKIMAGTGLELFLNPELLVEAKVELQESNDLMPYLCPIPVHIMPQA
ncbi:M20 family metallopeptidase [Marinomonas sp.]|jgi:aminobenzoyl-glutamate utilization protein B|uniref:M20 family metallopeptidase n=1 Tax=Marinomonas sp. TaxID=1904862 RepID=UPI003A91C850